jgi:hypothetical protein
MLRQKDSLLFAWLRVGKIVFSLSIYHYSHKENGVLLLDIASNNQNGARHPTP